MYICLCSDVRLRMYIYIYIHTHHLDTGIRIHEMFYLLEDPQGAQTGNDHILRPLLLHNAGHVTVP